MKSTESNTAVKRKPSSGLVVHKMRGGGQTDSVASEATFLEDEVEEIVREIPLPVGRGRPDPSLYPKENLRIPDMIDGVDDEEKHQETSGTIQTKHSVPSWFPRRVKKVFLVDRHGGQFTFKELELITRYRNAMERVKRIKWKTYLKAGHTRWQMHRSLRRMRPIANHTPKLSEYRKSQFEKWDKKALNSWKRLEKLQLGLRVLDEAIDINFRQERMIYEKRLGGRLCD